MRLKENPANSPLSFLRSWSLDSLPPLCLSQFCIECVDSLAVLIWNKEKHICFQSFYSVKCIATFLQIWITDFLSVLCSIYTFSQLRAYFLIFFVIIFCLTLLKFFLTLLKLNSFISPLLTLAFVFLSKKLTPALRLHRYFPIFLHESFKFLHLSYPKF